jgi:hypothetical protein
MVSELLKFSAGVQTIFMMQPKVLNVFDAI